MARRTRVKICGITRLDDAMLAEQRGADALGFVFCQASARYISPYDAKNIANQLGPFIVRVGLFLDAPEPDVCTALDAIPELILQFHGRETPSFCESFGRPYIKALGVGAGLPTRATLQHYESALAFLFDSNEPGQLGGTGHVFDWQQLDRQPDGRLVLAGGLNADNIEAAIHRVGPYAVDVSSGVELHKGIKDPEAIRCFIDAVQRADASNVTTSSPTIRISS